MERDFKGIWIPAEVWLNSNLCITEKVFLAEIDSLDKDSRRCYASNGYFSKFFNLSRSRCSEIISGLIKKGLVERRLKKDGERIISRHLHLSESVFGGVRNLEQVVGKQVEGCSESRQRCSENAKEITYRYNNREKASPSILDSSVLLDQLQQQFPEVQVQFEIDKMKDWLAATGKSKRDYLAFARNWMRKAESEFSANGKQITSAGGGMVL